MRVFSEMRRYQFEFRFYFPGTTCFEERWPPSVPERIKPKPQQVRQSVMRTFMVACSFEGCELNPMMRAAPERLAEDFSRLCWERLAEHFVTPRVASLTVIPVGDRERPEPFVRYFDFDAWPEPERRGRFIEFLGSSVHAYLGDHGDYERE